MARPSLVLGFGLAFGLNSGPVELPELYDDLPQLANNIPCAQVIPSSAVQDLVRPLYHFDQMVQLSLGALDPKL